MTRFDRYLLSQLLQVFGFFALVLVGLQWVNHAAHLFDWLIGDGQSAMVFLQMTLLALPGLISVVLPLAALVAAIYVGNRLMSESEMVVMQAAGFSAWRMMRPVLVFGLIVAAMVMVLNHALVPLSRGVLAERSEDIRQNITGRFLKDGQFTHPAPGVTLYIRALSERGELLDLFLEDRREGQDRIITARRALIAKSDTGPKLLMFEGAIQARREGRLSLARFSDFTYDMNGLIEEGNTGAKGVDQLPSPALLAMDQTDIARAGSSPEGFLREFHFRNSQPLLALSGALIGFGAIMIGSFSRFGLWRQVGVAVGLAIVVQGVNTVGFERSTAGGALAWMWLYAAAALGCFFGLCLILIAERPRAVARGGA